MPRIYIMRHAESVVNLGKRLTCRTRAGALTEHGREQALLAARWLNDKAISAIRTSPFERAVETARIIGEALGLPYVLDPDLGELDCGSLEGKDDFAAWEVWQAVYRRFLLLDTDAYFPEGESGGEAFGRFERALASARGAGNTLVVSHTGIARCVVPYLCVNASAMQRLDALPTTAFVVLEPYDSERYICEAWGLKAHLE